MLVWIIINPLAGGARRRMSIEDRRTLAHRVCRDHGAEPHIIVTAQPRHASQLAREAIEKNASLVLAWGGDGTMNEVARVLVGGRTPLGLVPAGSGNGLARELGISAVPATAIAQALTGVDRAIDGAMLGDQYFFNIAGIGLDARIARLFNERHTAARGFAKYVQTGIVELMRYKPATYALSANGSYDSGSAVFIAFANGRQYGNNVFVAPDARLDDGLLDAVMIGPSGTMSQIWRARRLFSGRLMDDPLVRTLRASEIAVDAEAELAFHCDGEIHTGPRHLVARSLPGALLVRVPG